MTLPDSECKRINKASKLISPDDIGVESLVNFCQKSEAGIWYERMGKFAEWVSNEGYSYNTDGKHWWDRYNNILTTPELITEFLNQLNEGK